MNILAGILEAGRLSTRRMSARIVVSLHFVSKSRLRLESEAHYRFRLP
jgi:hypothetical protein